MNYEKKYKKSLERAKKLYKDAITLQLEQDIKDYEYIFPELKESEDDRIKESLMQYIWNIYHREYCPPTPSIETCDKWIAWLEKQGEKKATDKDEPKFKVGDWIISKYMHLVMQILNNDNGSYKTLETDGTERNDSYDFIERNFKLWTIDDAKDGDVLATENFIFIFKNIDDGNGVHYYCQYEISKHEDDNQFDIALPQSLMGRVGNSIIHYSPATKEQRDTLFKAMAKAGYQWNPDTKELKKVEHKPTWSEDDERIVTALMEGFRYHQLFNPRFGEVPNAEIISWIKSLKERLS